MKYLTLVLLVSCTQNQRTAVEVPEEQQESQKENLDSSAVGDQAVHAPETPSLPNAKEDKALEKKTTACLNLVSEKIEDLKGFGINQESEDVLTKIKISEYYDVMGIEGKSLDLDVVAKIACLNKADIEDDLKKTHKDILEFTSGQQGITINFLDLTKFVKIDIYQKQSFLSGHDLKINFKQDFKRIPTPLVTYDLILDKTIGITNNQLKTLPLDLWPENEFYVVLTEQNNDCFIRRVEIASKD